MSAPRNCLACTHCYFEGGSHHYSELTPGAPMILRCEKDHWDAEGRFSKEALVTGLDKALTCKDWNPEPGHEGDVGVDRGGDPTKEGDLDV